jgi:hypothetical protein
MYLLNTCAGALLGLGRGHSIVGNATKMGTAGRLGVLLNIA